MLTLRSVFTKFCVIFCTIYTVRHSNYIVLIIFARRRFCY